MKTPTRTQRQVAAALLTGLATALHVIEGFLPPLPFPGARIGLANVATLLALRTLGARSAVGVSVMRSLLGGLAGGTLFGPGFWMGFGGAVASSLVMATGAKLASGARSNVVISIAGAIAHSTVQVMVAVQLMRHPGLWGYWPFLTLASSVTGFFIGLVCDRSLSLVTRNIAPERKPQCV